MNADIKYLKLNAQIHYFGSISTCHINSPTTVQSVTFMRAHSCFQMWTQIWRSHQVKVKLLWLAPFSIFNTVRS